VILKIRFNYIIYFLKSVIIIKKGLGLHRRDFLKASLFVGAPLFAKRNDKLHFFFPKKPFEYFHKKSKNAKYRVMIIGGIHGNEMGAYKAADILIDAKLKKGELLIIPRSNFTSILANVRGYNGDMNRKFDTISKKDADFYYVELLKEAILNYKPDVLISIHDGYGFNIENKMAWGQSVVIDELRYKNFDLFKEASFVQNNANRYLKRKLSLINTRTFSSHIHDEQKKALTGWCLEHNIKAFCIEASKQLPTLEEKIKTHLAMLREFFKLYEVEIEGFDEMIKNPDKFLDKRRVEAKVRINNQIYTFSNTKKLKLPKKSQIEFLSFNGGRGSFAIPRGINLNWSKFYATNLNIDIKNDFEKQFRLKIRS